MLWRLFLTLSWGLFSAGNWRVLFSYFILSGFLANYRFRPAGLSFFYNTFDFRYLLTSQEFFASWWHFLWFWSFLRLLLFFHAFWSSLTLFYNLSHFFDNFSWLFSKLNCLALLLTNLEFFWSNIRLILKIIMRTVRNNMWRLVLLLSFFIVFNLFPIHFLLFEDGLNSGNELFSVFSSLSHQVLVASLCFLGSPRLFTFLNFFFFIRFFDWFLFIVILDNLFDDL